MAHEYMIFPIKDSQSFEVRSEEDYKQLIMVIGQETLNLISEFPDKHIWVVYETEEN